MQKGIIKNVNKLTGEPIDAKDLASMLSGIIGNESGVLTVFDELRLEKISDNKVRLHSGVYSLKGHILYIPKGSYEDFTIDSGTLGANRIDLLVAEYVKNGEGDGEDILRFRVLEGESTSGEPQSPDLVQQDINANGITRQEPLYRLKLNNLSLSYVSSFNKIATSQKLDSNIDGLNKITTEKIKEIDNRMSETVYRSRVLYGRQYVQSPGYPKPLRDNQIRDHGIIKIVYTVADAKGENVIGYGDAVFHVQNGITTMAYNNAFGSRPVKMNVFNNRQPQFIQNLGIDVYINWIVYQGADDL